jgi:branched-chain amino acid transport system substrate-binding protein
MPRSAGFTSADDCGAILRVTQQLAVHKGGSTMKLDRRQFLATGLAAGAAALAGPRIALAQAESLRIGALTPLTGGGAVYGTSMSRMYALVADEINKAGGVGGKPIQVFTEDDQTNPDAGVRGARKLVDVNKVHAILGTWSSAVTLAVAPIAVQARIPHFCVSSSPAISTFKDDDFLYRTAYSQAVISTVYATTAQKLGFKTAALLILNNPYGIGLGDSFPDSFAKVGGKVTGKVVYNPNQSSYRSEIQQALAGKPDVILFGGYTPDGVQVFKEWFQLGLGGTWMGPGFALDQKFIQGIGAQAAEGIVVVEGAPNLSSAAYKNADKLFRAAHNEPADFFAAMAYDHLMVIALSALAAKGDTAGDAIKANIRKVANPPGKVVGTWADAAPLVRAGEKVNYEGASSAADFDQNGDVQTDFGVYRIKTGKWELDRVIKFGELKTT